MAARAASPTHGVVVADGAADRVIASSAGMGRRRDQHPQGGATFVEGPVHPASGQPDAAKLLVGRPPRANPLVCQPADYVQFAVVVEDALE
jgi:hypothetical protein